MWYLELCVDNGAEYITEFSGLYKHKELAEEKANKTFHHVKILKFVEIIN